MTSLHPASANLLSFVGDRQFATLLADPPWRFANSTGKVAPEHKRLSRYSTMSLDEIAALPVPQITARTAHLVLMVPECALAGRPRGGEGLGLHVQKQSRLAQDPQGRRI
ncbi:MAG: hypothetical protein U1E81_05960 [Xanthobacteraceae bacterium]